MCEFKAAKSNRPINRGASVRLIDYYDFVKLSKDKVFRILTSDSRDNYSKSYYYYIRDYLNKIKVLKENMIDVRFVFPFEKTKDSISLRRGLLYLTRDGEIVYMNLHSNIYETCSVCKVKALCVYYAKKIVEENKLRTKVDEEEPLKSWEEIINKLQSKEIKTKVIEIT